MYFSYLKKKYFSTRIQEIFKPRKSVKNNQREKLEHVVKNSVNHFEKMPKSYYTKRRS